MSYIRLSALLGASLFAMPLIAAENAPASCRALSENACAEASECVWVQGYERRDGRQVAPYCRKRPQRAAESVDGGDAGAASRSARSEAADKG